MFLYSIKQKLNLGNFFEISNFCASPSKKPCYATDSDPNPDSNFDPNPYLNLKENVTLCKIDI